jgi:hypothetical protein
MRLEVARGLMWASAKRSAKGPMPLFKCEALAVE